MQIREVKTPIALHIDPQETNFRGLERGWIILFEDTKVIKGFKKYNLIYSPYHGSLFWVTDYTLWKHTKLTGELRYAGTCCGTK